MCDPQQVALADLIVEVNHIRIAEQHTASAEGLAQFLRVVSAMDIDKAFPGIVFRLGVVPGLHALESQDTTCDEIGLLLGFRQLIKMVGDADTSFKNRSCWCAATNFGGNGVHTSRRAERVGNAGGRILRGRANQLQDDIVVFQQPELLAGNGNI